MKLKILFLALSFLVLPIVAGAQVVINEIMYDLPGTDSGREWIEIMNTGNAAVDLNGWKFFENNTNHSLISVQGGLILSTGSFAVIADQPDNFLIDWPDFSGMLVDSAFSLANTNEYLAIKDSASDISDETTYSSDSGATGDGNSLQKTLSGNWIVAPPTPGLTNIQTLSSPPTNDDPDQNANDDSSTSEAVSAHSSPTVLSPVAKPPSKPLMIDPGRPRLVSVGAPVHFKAKLTNAAKEPGIRINWSFGDGAAALGPEPIHNYYFPGTYIVVTNVSQGDEQAVARTTVEVVKPQAEIGEAGLWPKPHIQIINNSSRELNLGYWQISAASRALTLPPDTLIAGNSRIYLPLDPAKVSLTGASVLELLYPNGQLAAAKTLVWSQAIGGNIDLPNKALVGLDSTTLNNLKQTLEKLAKLIANLSKTNEVF